MLLVLDTTIKSPYTLPLRSRLTVTDVEELIPFIENWDLAPIRVNLHWLSHTELEKLLQATMKHRNGITFAALVLKLRPDYPQASWRRLIVASMRVQLVSSAMLEWLVEQPGASSEETLLGTDEKYLWVACRTTQPKILHTLLTIIPTWDTNIIKTALTIARLHYTSEIVTVLLIEIWRRQVIPVDWRQRVSPELIDRYRFVPTIEDQYDDVD